MKKMSYVSAVRYAIERLSADANPAMNDAEFCEELTPVIEKLSALAETLEKRASRKVEGPTKAQKERMALAETVFEAMEDGVSYGTAEIAGLVPALEGATPQKVTPLMKLLGERIVTEKVKGKAVYKKA